MTVVGTWHKKETPWGWMYLYIENSVALLLSNSLPNTYKDSKSMASFPHAWDKAMDLYISGKNPSWPNYLAKSNSDFAQKVWTRMRQISWGATVTYGKIAADIGFPKAARAVGKACGANPLLLVQPCHRVVAANGLGGFSAGLELKVSLLKHESC